jgi:hypothetical protein
MEMWEDNIIEQKLNGLDKLPEGYAPNLELKWSVLEAGLEGKSRKKPFAWKRYAIAAMLLMLGGAGFRMLRPAATHTTGLPETKMPVAAEILVTDEILPIEQKTPAPAEHQQSKRNRPPQQLLISIVPQTPVAVIQPETTATYPTEPGQQQLATRTRKTSKPRFVEVDFNDIPVIDEHSSDPVIAAHQFRMRLGGNPGTQSSSPAGGSPSLKFTQTLN